jgi:hypothetical protein
MIYRLPHSIDSQMTDHPQKRRVHLRRLDAVLLAVALLAATGCAQPRPAPQPVPATASFQTLISDRLYFGRDIPDGGTVSDADWDRFLAEVVTPRFPAGLSVWQARGQWRDRNAIIQHEDSMILDLLHPDDAASEKSVQEIMTEYKLRFRQEAVLRVRDAVRVQFW